MSNNPTVSVICACYNQAAFIVESLDSVKNQTFRDFEMIIWDDASKDNSVAIIEKWISENPGIRVQFVKHTTNKGICASLNECYGLSTGKYIQMLALDDLLLPWKLEKQVALLESSPQSTGLIFSDAYIINNDGKQYQNRFIAYHKRYLELASGNFFQELIIDNFIPAMSVLMKRSALEAVGPWDEQLVYEDYDMWLRMAKKYDFAFDPEPSVKYRMHDSNTHKVLRPAMVMSTFKLLLKHSEVPEMNKRLRQEVKDKYLTGQLQQEAQLFFEKHPPENFMDRLIQKNSSPFVYKVFSRINRKHT